MKINFILTVLTLLMLAGCKKNYSCICKPETNPQYYTTVSERSKSKAKINCENQSITPNGQEEIPVEKTTCTLQ
jgi:hypothetical protein